MSGQIELPDEINGWSLTWSAHGSIRYAGRDEEPDRPAHEQVLTATVDSVIAEGHDLGTYSVRVSSSMKGHDIAKIDERDEAAERLVEWLRDHSPADARELLEDDQDNVDEDFQTAAEISADGAGDVVADLEVRGTDEETRAERRDVVRSVLEYIQQHGNAGKSEIEAEILEDDRGGYKTTLAAWKHLVRPGLADLSEQLDELQRPRAGESWSWSEAEDTDTETPLRKQVEALEAGDVIRLECHGEETVELEIVDDGDDRLTVLSETGDRYDVEEVDGEIVTTGRELGDDSVDSIRLVEIAAENDNLERQKAEIEEAESVLDELQDDGLEDQDEPAKQAELESDADKRGPGELLAVMADDADRSDEVAKAARELVADELEALIERGLSPAQALDYWFTEDDAERTYGQLSVKEWAEVRGRSHQAIYDSLGRARDALEGEDEEG